MDLAALGLNETGALLERAYRMALALQSHANAAAAGLAEVPASAFEQLAIAAELVALLDDARVSLLGRLHTDESPRPQA